MGSNPTQCTPAASLFKRSPWSVIYQQITLHISQETMYVIFIKHTHMHTHTKYLNKLSSSKLKILGSLFVAFLGPLFVAYLENLFTVYHLEYHISVVPIILKEAVNCPAVIIQSVIGAIFSPKM